MSSLDEEPRVTCPSCGRRVPAMVYCIYCGTKLPKPAPPVPPQGVAKPPPQIPPSVPPPLPPVPMMVEREIADLMTDISASYERKVSLLNMFKSGEVSEGVFSKLYDEYNSKMNNILNARIQKMEELRGKLDEKDKRLAEVGVSLEELNVRYKVGELDSQRFADILEKMKKEEKELRVSMEILRTSLNRLERMLAEKTPREILDLESKTKSCYDTLEKLVEEGKFSIETLNKIRPDIETTLSFFDSLIGDRKEKEKKLKEQLDTLNARYRVSEISIEEYEKRKRELQAEIDKIWA